MAKTKRQQISIDGRDLPLSNLDKVLFHDGQVRKADVFSLTIARRSYGLQISQIWRSIRFFTASRASIDQLQSCWFLIAQREHDVKVSRD